MTFPTWRNTERGQRGFTLIELLLVIGVMSLALGLSLPRIGAVRTSFFAAEEAREVAGFIRAARHDAVANRTTVGLTASLDAVNTLEQRRLTVRSWRTGDSGRPEAEDTGHGDIWDADIVRRATVSGRVQLVTEGPGILFYANGTSSGGEVMILAEDGSLQRHFRIDPGTGEFISQSGPDF